MDVLKFFEPIDQNHRFEPLLNSTFTFMFPVPPIFYGGSTRFLGLVNSTGPKWNMNMSLSMRPQVNMDFRLLRSGPGSTKFSLDFESYN